MDSVLLLCVKNVKILDVVFLGIVVSSVILIVKLLFKFRNCRKSNVMIGMIKIWIARLMFTE